MAQLTSLEPGCPEIRTLQVCMGPHGKDSPRFLFLQPENSFDFVSKEMFVHLTRNLQANVLLIK